MGLLETPELTPSEPLEKKKTLEIRLIGSFSGSFELESITLAQLCFLLCRFPRRQSTFASVEIRRAVMPPYCDGKFSPSPGVSSSPFGKTPVL